MPSHKKTKKTCDKDVRRYNSYKEETILKALREIGRGRISINKAARNYNIAKGTLMNKVHKEHENKVGRPLALTTIKEDCIVQNIIAVREWGFPFSRADLCHLIKIYLDKSKRPFIVL